MNGLTILGVFLGIGVVGYAALGDGDIVGNVLRIAATIRHRIGGWPL
jgi:F0F1-type ATP synthase membrane subunit c/vacuolar-type H+-ATPase subunit K